MINGVKLSGAIKSFYNASKNVANDGAIVFSTAKKSNGTFYDAFVHTMSKSENALKAGREISAQAQTKAEIIEKKAKDILTNSGVDADLSVRVKSPVSVGNKIVKYLGKFGSYEKEQEKVKDIILGKGMSEIIGDAFGIRYIINSEMAGKVKSSNKLLNEILTTVKNDRQFTVKSLENYYGTGINPYASKNVCDRFSELTYSSNRGLKKHTFALLEKKPAGYTRVNADARINGINTEIQVGGKYTTKWGNVEHLLYDMRQGKDLDMSKYTPEQIKIATEIQRDYRTLMQKSKEHDFFVDNYLSKVWKFLKNSEEKNLNVPEFPPFPAGYPESLKVENIMKLAHV